ncbi:MAG: hypothetical protein KTR32_09965, partial [Granulosicoccus sp.]|nr:hypothetical protein [Granulosicoccus sp.]
ADHAVSSHRSKFLRSRFWLAALGLPVLIVLQTPALAYTVVISNERSGDLVIMNESGETTDIIEACGRPRGMVQNKANKTLFVACSDDGTVIELDITSKQIKRTFNNLSGAMSLAFHEPTQRLIVSNEGSAQATVLNTVSGETLASLATGLEPDGVAWTDNGELIFVASENAGLVHVFDGKTYRSIQSLVTNLRPRRLALRDGELWVSSEMGSRVEIFDIESLDKIDEIIFAPKGFRSEQLTPVDILFDSTKKKGIIALGSANNVVIVDASTREILKYILVGRRPWGLALTSDDKRLFVLNGLSDDVTIIDLEKMRPIRTTRTGLVPHAVEILP